MLTKSDLVQIGSVIDEKLGPVKKDLGTLKKDVRYLKKTVSVLVNRADREETSLGKRVKRIEEHLQI